MFQPTRLGRYLLLKKIATGGMAEIFLAKLEGAAGFEKYVIIKKILPQWSQDPQFISMLIDEAKISVQLNHPSIVQIYELGREEDTYYIVMEYVQGVDVRKLLAKCQALKKKIPQEIALFIICEILEALGYAHVKKDSQGHPLEIIHRDISPQNILVSMEGAVKLTDFGIAKAASRHQETMTGVLKGKFAYMSPEQAGQLPMDHRSDLYALAIVLYELLTQERLFYRGSDIETLDRVRRGQISFSENAEKNIPEKLKEILLKALALKMEDRYLDAHLFRDDLISYVRKFGKDLRRDRMADFVRELLLMSSKLSFWMW
ncbi:MAG: serine/threonine protein kinase [Deltaproteobacteria bacterium]|nr:MAG: serine/threonine protein kinase [Deltaproteobacteria bacterium]